MKNHYPLNDISCRINGMHYCCVHPESLCPLRDFVHSLWRLYILSPCNCSTCDYNFLLVSKCKARFRVTNIHWLDVINRVINLQFVLENEYPKKKKVKLTGSYLSFDIYIYNYQALMRTGLNNGH